MEILEAGSMGILDSCHFSEFCIFIGLTTGYDVAGFVVVRVHTGFIVGLWVGTRVMVCSANG